MPLRQREEAFEPAGDIGLDLLRRHAGIERRHHDHRNVDRREHVHRHPDQTRHAHHRNEQADNHDEIWIAYGKARHNIESLGPRYYIVFAVIVVTFGRTS